MPQINPNQIPSNNRNQFIQQLTNQAAGDYATINTAITFKEHMTTAFMQKLSPDSPLRQSMDKNKSSQTQLFSLMQSGNILSQKQTNPIFDNHFNGTTDNKGNTETTHLHASYLGTNTHSVDVVFTKNDHGMFATVCNRGLRGNHDIFETYKLNDTGNTEDATKLLENVHNTEKNGGSIDDFYGCFGSKINNKELKSHGFKPPPGAKDQKVGNCVRASISAAQKWMAHQHDCMDAHKAVKSSLLNQLTTSIHQISKQFASKLPIHQKITTQHIRSTKPMDKTVEFLKRVVTNAKLNSKDRESLDDLLDAIGFLKEIIEETPDPSTTKLQSICDQLLRELARISEENRANISQLLTDKMVRSSQKHLDLPLPDGPSQ